MSIPGRGLDRKEIRTRNKPDDRLAGLARTFRGRRLRRLNIGQRGAGAGRRISELYLRPPISWPMVTRNPLALLPLLLFYAILTAKGEVKRPDAIYPLILFSSPWICIITPGPLSFDSGSLPTNHLSQAATDEVVPIRRVLYSLPVVRIVVRRDSF